MFQLRMPHLFTNGAHYDKIMLLIVATRDRCQGDKCLMQHLDGNADQSYR